MISKENAEHYVWGDSCDGWYLLNRQDMLIIHEKCRRAPAKSATIIACPDSSSSCCRGSYHGTGGEEARDRRSAGAGNPRLRAPGEKR